MVKGKIVIRKIDCSKSRQVTFFKRRTGLLKKAKELSVLCDAEIGIVVFSCTGKLYDYSSTSMESVIERYNGTKKGHARDDPVADEVQLLKKEAQSLMQQLNCLQDCHRHLMGEGLSKLSFKDLRELEKLLEMSLKNIRTKKDESYREGLREIKQKIYDLDQENKELRKRLNNTSSSSTNRSPHCRRVGVSDILQAGEEVSAIDDHSSRSPLESSNSKEDVSNSIVLGLSLRTKP